MHTAYTTYTYTRVPYTTQYTHHRPQVYILYTSLPHIYTIHHNSPTHTYDTQTYRHTNHTSYTHHTLHVHLLHKLRTSHYMPYNIQTAHAHTAYHAPYTKTILYTTHTYTYQMHTYYTPHTHQDTHTSFTIHHPHPYPYHTFTPHKQKRMQNLWVLILILSFLLCDPTQVI